jgi:hypothetical protein
MIRKGEDIEKIYKIEGTLGEYTPTQGLFRSRQEMHQQKNRANVRVQNNFQVYQ